MSTYSYTAIQAAGHQVDVVELQACYGTGMADQAPVYLTASQIPQSNHAVRRATRQSGFENLQSTDEIGRI